MNFGGEAYAHRRLWLFVICLIGFFLVIPILLRLAFTLSTILKAPEKDEYTRIYKDYCILPNIFNNQNEEQQRITQIVHVSGNYLDEGLIEQVENWNAPVSLAVVIPHLEQYTCILKRLKLLLSISPITARFLRVHFVYPSAWSSTCAYFPLLETECFDPQPSLDDVASYPVNIARNAARMYSSSKYILFADYKSLFSAGFEEEVSEIADQELGNEKKLFAYRAFEIQETSMPPETKEDLEKLMDNGEAVAFHSKFYTGAEDMPLLKEWLAKNFTDSGIFMTDVKFTKSEIVPHFVTRRHVPLHDANFPFLARDNRVLSWELCRMGYSMDLLSNHFMVHRGIKTKDNLSEIAPIQLRNYFRYKKALEDFNRRMNNHFPDENGRCPIFT